MNKKEAAIQEKFNKFKEVVNKKEFLVVSELSETSGEIVSLGKSDEAMELLNGVNRIIVKACAGAQRVGKIDNLERSNYLDELQKVLVNNREVMAGWSEAVNSVILLPGKLEENMTPIEKIIEAGKMVDIVHATRSQISADYFQRIQDLLLDSGEDLKVRNLFWHYTVEMQKHYHGKADLKEILQKNYETLYNWLDKGLVCQVEGVNPPSQAKQREVVKERRVNL